MRMHATLDGLSTLIETLRSVPGRKAVILFSEGLATGGSRGVTKDAADAAIHDNRWDHFIAVLEEANRAHVAFYTFDAAGLRAQNPSAAARFSAGAYGGAFGRAVEGSGHGSPFGLEPYVGLLTLAKETGGAYTENTNDLRAAVGRVASDLRHYYLLGYVSNRKMDGKFHKIDVRVRRRNVSVLARRGYRATPQPEAAVVRPHEVAPFLLLDSAPVPNAFPVRLGVFTFPERDRPGRAVILVGISEAAQVNAPMPHSSATRADVTVVVRIRDASGRAIRHVSERFQRPLASEGTASSPTGEVVLKKEVDLPVGVSRIEVIAYEANQGQASMRFATVEVPGVSRLRLSSLMLIDDAERVDGQWTSNEPDGATFRVGDWLVRPRLGEPLTGNDVAFAFVAYSGTRQEPLRGSIAVLKDGRSLGAEPIALERGDDGEKVEYVGRVELKGLEPGTYQLALVVEQASARVAGQATFRIAEGHGRE